jgi:hypothetical protein
MGCNCCRKEYIIIFNTINEEYGLPKRVKIKYPQCTASLDVP